MTKLPGEGQQSTTAGLLNQLLVTIGTEIQGGQEDTPEFLHRVNELATEVYKKAAEDPANSPDAVISRITGQYWEAAPSRPMASLDSVISRYGVNLGRFRRVGLSPFDEVALLKATVHAGFSRQTKRGYQLARGAVRVLHHEATNIAFPEERTNPIGQVSDLVRLERAVFATGALQELYKMEDTEPIPSIDETLRNWSTLLDKTREGKDSVSEIDVLVAEAEEYIKPESRVSIRRLLSAEIPDRIEGLRFIGRTLQDKLGEDVNVRYFETVVFSNQDEVLEGEQAVEEGSKDAEHIEDEEKDEPEQSSYFGSDYVLAEITQALPDGGKMVHVVAESPNWGNACYVLRGDTLQVLSSVLGESIDWRTVCFPKVTTRQLGAINFRHVNGTTVPEKVLRYLSLEVKDTLPAIAKKWFFGAKPIYDESLQVTPHNRLPKNLAEVLTPRLPQIHHAMAEWLNEGATGSVIIDIGRQATRGSQPEPTSAAPIPEQIDDSLRIRNQELVVENEQLRLANMHLEQRVAELEGKIKNASESLK